MTRIAILADIHGNLPAFEAVQADLAQVAPDRVIVNGDVINRGPQSSECLEAVRATGWPVVFGNHEEYILKYAAGSLPEEFFTDLWLPTRTVFEAMREDELAYMRALPWHLVVDVPGLPPVRIVHGSPRSLSEGIGFWQPDGELLAMAESVPEPVLVGAHTHRPFDRRVGDRWFLNTGAIGVPFNGDPSAQYLVLEARNGAWEAEFRTVPYDRTPVYDAWARSGQLERSTIAHVFKYEVETATFHLMAYLNFCDVRGLARDDLESFNQYRIAARGVLPGRSFRHAPSGDPD